MNNAFELLIGSVGAAACWVLWFYFVKDLKVDALREELFSIRRDLFLLMASGEISPDSRCYIQLRAMLNGTLQFAHRISLRASIVADKVAETNPDQRRVSEEWQLSLSSAPDEVRNRLDNLHRRMVRAYMNHLVHGSVILSVMVAVFIIQSAFKRLLLILFTKSRGTNFDVLDIAINDIASSFNTQALEEQAYRDQTDPRDLMLA